MKSLPVLFLLLFLFSSCEKDVNFDLQDNAARLVVDAKIEEGQPPVVILTKSIGYFNTFSPELFNGLFVSNGQVTISNGTLTHTLKPYQMEVSPGLSVSYYTIDSANLQTAFIGELNKTYTLNIVAEGKTYDAVTTIPGHYATLDSMWAKPVNNFEDSLARQLMVTITDPPGRGNYLRYFTALNNTPFLPPLNSVADDQVIDGTTFTLQVDIGIDKNNIPEGDEQYFYRGDTLSLKFCNIDRTTYTFWSTWEFAFQSIGNPFSQPNKIIGNISNGALGVFAGYACRYKTIVVD